MVPRSAIASDSQMDSWQSQDKGEAERADGCLGPHPFPLVRFARTSGAGMTLWVGEDDRAGRDGRQRSVLTDARELHEAGTADLAAGWGCGGKVGGVRCGLNMVWRACAPWPLGPGWRSLHGGAMLRMDAPLAGMTIWDEARPCLTPACHPGQARAETWIRCKRRVLALRGVTCIARAG
jgi:hypothetical protein